MAVIVNTDTDGSRKGPVTEQNPFPTKVIAPRRIPISGGQLGLTVSTTVIVLTVPDAAISAEIYVRTASITFTRSSGILPTTTAGFQADDTDIIVLRSRGECLEFRTIRVSADATLDVEYFSEAE